MSGQPTALEAFSALERWLDAPATQQLALGHVERECERQGRELLRRLLQDHVHARGDGDVGAALEVRTPEGVLRYARKRSHTRRHVTLFGEITITRIGYGRPGHASIHPLDAELALPARCYSYELQRRLVTAAVHAPFDDAVRLLAEATGVAIPKRSAEQIVIDAACDFDAFYAGRAQRGDAPTDGPILVGAVDCKGIPMVKPEPAAKTARLRKGQKRQKKKMATVGCVFSQQPHPRTPDDVVASLFALTDRQQQDDGAAKRRRRPRPPQRKRVWASLLADKDTFITDVRAEMLRRDPDHERAWVIVTDGERALQRRITKIFKHDHVTLILDLLHVLEKLWKAAYVFHPEGSPQAEAFVRERALRILRGQVSGVVQGLRQTVTKRQLQGQRRDTLLAVASYLYRNRERMRYDHYLANGWPIASGSVEGACKNLVKDRMERSGMRWSPDGAEAMLRLRATHLSGDFDAYWDFHVQQDQQRLYPDGLWTLVAK
jgi:hypothetical protein